MRQQYYRLGVMAGERRDILCAREEDRVEDDPAEVWIAIVAVRVPIGAAQVDLDVAAEAFAVD